MPGENILQSFQKLATVSHRLDELEKKVDQLDTKQGGRLDRLENQLADIRERLARLETSRNADRAEMQAELARFKVEVERAEFRLTKLLPGSSGSGTDAEKP